MEQAIKIIKAELQAMYDKRANMPYNTQTTYEPMINNYISGLEFALKALEMKPIGE